MSRLPVWLRELDAEPVPTEAEVWAGFADAARSVLEERERERREDPLYGLSEGAVMVLHVLAATGGSARGAQSADWGAIERTQEAAGFNVTDALLELADRGFVELTWVVVEGEWPPTPFVMLRYRGPLPPWPEG